MLENGSLRHNSIVSVAIYNAFALWIAKEELDTPTINAPITPNHTMEITAVLATTSVRVNPFLFLHNISYTYKL